MTKPKAEVPPFEKEIVRLPDGRELTYYRFPDPPSRAERGSRGTPGAATGTRGSPDEKER
jgi:hypothetical protein